MPRRLKTDIRLPELEDLLRHHYQQVPQAETHVDQWIAKAQAGSSGYHQHLQVRSHFRTALVFLAVGGMAGIVLHWAPRVDAVAWAATRNTPLLNRLADSLHLPGMGALVGSHKVIPLDVTDRHDGVTVQVVGTYADTAQTMVFLRTTKGMAFSSQQITLRDQFGDSLYPNSAAWNDTTHAGYVDFSALPSWVWVPGVRLTLTIHSMGTSKNPLTDVYPGPWQLQWVQAPPGASQTLFIHARTRVDGITMSLIQILLAPSASVLHMSSSMPLNTTPTMARNAKGRGPQFTITHADSGTAIPILSASGGGTQMTLMSNPLPPGRYILRVWWWNQKNGPWELPFAVPGHYH
ncbi:MAG: hypothetical protein M1499_08655 [Firmicutes bacterium]|nr:hypothetical protein [Bacillota bacterium]MCL5972613.1 hypothetical protein [Bacillota bacterium]